MILDSGVPDRRVLLGRAPLGTVLAGNVDAPSRWKDLAYVAHAALGLRPKPHRLNTERVHASAWGMSLYRPEPIDIALLVVNALDGAPGRDLGAWARYTTGGCTVLDVPGDHHSILTPPHLHRMADALLAALAALAAVAP